MTEDEMQDYFPTTYPKMFVGHYGGIAVGKGWFGILSKLCSNIQSHIDWRAKHREITLNYNQMARAGKSGDAELFADLVAQEYGDKGFDEVYIRNRCEEMIREPLRQMPDECPQVVIEQVKEKFGTLRFYYQGGDEYIRGLVSMAESMTDITCESCGNPGERYGSGWVHVACPSCEEQRQKKRAEYENQVS